MKQQSGRSWIAPAALLLFLAAILLLPVCLKYAYAGAAAAPANTLTYSPGKLVWDSAASVRPDGTAELGFFDDNYTNVRAADGSDVVAPGTKATRTIRLVSTVPHDIGYKALIYRLHRDDSLPVNGILEGTGLEDSASLPPLPDGVPEEDVIRVVEGTLRGNAVQDFDVGWEWVFYESAEQDVIDTSLGNTAENETTFGFYLMTEDNVTPKPPKTGDETPLRAYAVLAAVGFFVLLLLFFTRERGDKKA